MVVSVVTGSDAVETTKHYYTCKYNNACIDLSTYRWCSLFSLTKESKSPSTTSSMCKSTKHSHLSDHLCNLHIDLPQLPLPKIEMSLSTLLASYSIYFIKLHL